MQQQGGQAGQERGQPVVIDLAVRAGPAPPPPTPIPNLRLATMKSSPLLQSQDILAALTQAVDSAGDDLLVTERTRGIPSARSDGQCMPHSPLSRYMAETAFQEKKHMIRTLDQAAMERATTPAARPAAAAPHASRLAGHGSSDAAEARGWSAQASSSSQRGFKGLLFACFGR